jgi:HEAT repeat protein
MVILSMEITEDIKEVREIFQTLIKAKKTIRMYPQSNPVYQKTLEDVYEKFNAFFDYKDELPLKINQLSILYESEQVYHNPEKDDNFALFFFKDGLRELKFIKGLTQSELEEFLRIIALDFEREAVDDDIVTLLWERDFQNIQYVVDEAFLVDSDDENYEVNAEEKLAEQVTDVNDLMKAYADGFIREDVKALTVIPLTDKDLQLLVHELERDSGDKTDKLVIILFELISQSDSKGELEDAFSFLKDTIKFSMEHGEIAVVLSAMKKAKQIIENPLMPDNKKKYMVMLSSFLGTEEIIAPLAELLDSGIEIDPVVFDDFLKFLDKNAIEPMIKYLGELKTVRARKSVIEALIILGKRDIQTVARGLDDERWYVVRNIIYILRKIGDKRAIEYLFKFVRHGDIRVRKEVIKALGELGGREVVQTLRECLDDPEPEVRIASAKAFSTIGSEVAKKILLDKIADKEFKEKEFEEKREFYELLSRWKDADVFDFLMRTLKKKTFFGKGKNDENRACAALCLGLLGNKDALPLLYKIKGTNNKILRDFSQHAIKKLEHGQ